MGENTQNDPQPTMWYIMRPQEGFEEVYQGRPHSTPIPLYWHQADGALPMESEKLRLGYDSLLAAYLQVARGATVMLLFPRVQGLWYQATNVYIPSVQQYTYQLRWRQRPLDDCILTKGEKRYSTNNNVSSYSPTRRLVIPCSQGEVITPAYPEDGTVARGVYTANGVRVVDQQGVYNDGLYRDAGDDIADFALGATGYPPRYVRCDGDEMGIVAYRPDEDNWDFTYNTGSDWPFSDTFGVGHQLMNGTLRYQHAINPGAGVYVALVARATTP